MRSPEELLKDRLHAKLEWAEPWPSLSADGIEVPAYITLSASVHDCIALARRSAVSEGKGASYTDYQLLDSFITTHWATEKIDEP